ncbi:MAG TPA: nucleotidyltransferase family protein [Candidatus Acidoferrales bacterium]|nr:nucleotidyltransferase family protein [Candidatus Acidoferrales bacterium]
MELSRDAILRALESNDRNIKKLGATGVGLFGSYARGEQRSESDIDILVEFSSGKKSFHNYMQLKLFLERIFKRKVDLVMRDPITPELKRSILESTILKP